VASSFASGLEPGVEGWGRVLGSRLVRDDADAAHNGDS
jgi:hypothetical protein